MGMIPTPLPERWPDETDEHWKDRLGWEKDRNREMLRWAEDTRPTPGATVAIVIAMVAVVVVAFYKMISSL